jgi:hypothetical protein
MPDLRDGRWGEMPKENVDCVAIKGFRAEVGWKVDSHVQVATVNLNSPFVFEGDDADAGKCEGWYVTLDREGINRMIRALRKARDAAFGADA